ncbi:MAG: hypothetical protein ACI4XF_11330 [Oscillospiraceae bacterium]
MISEYVITYWRRGDDYTQYYATVCAYDRIAAAKLFGQFYTDCEIISVRRVVPERAKPTRKRGLLARLFGGTA